eukprot:7995357-Heterocapsa_arctica.AAC.1
MDGKNLCDPTKWYPSETPPLKEVIVENLLITIRHRFRHRTINMLLNTAEWDAYKRACSGYKYTDDRHKSISHH